MHRNAGSEKQCLTVSHQERRQASIIVMQTSIMLSNSALIRGAHQSSDPFIVEEVDGFGVVFAHSWMDGRGQVKVVSAVLA